MFSEPPLPLGPLPRAGRGRSRGGQCGQFCFLSKRVSFWRQTGCRLIQSVGENNSGCGSNESHKREAPDLSPASRESGGFK